jgi:hypothetical protein
MFCREKRIIKRTYADGSVRYIGQSKNFWGRWEDGDGKEFRNGSHRTYEEALEWYGGGRNSTKDEVILGEK